MLDLLIFEVRLQMAVATVTIVPVRLLLMCIFTFLAWIITLFLVIGIKEEEILNKPLTGWRR